MSYIFLGTRGQWLPMAGVSEKEKGNEARLVNISFLTDVQIDHVHLKGDCFFCAVSGKRLPD